MGAVQHTSSMWIRSPTSTAHPYMLRAAPPAPISNILRSCLTLRQGIRLMTKASAAEGGSTASRKSQSLKSLCNLDNMLGTGSMDEVPGGDGSSGQKGVAENGAAQPSSSQPSSQTRTNHMSLDNLDSILGPDADGSSASDGVTDSVTLLQSPLKEQSKTQVPSPSWSESQAQGPSQSQATEPGQSLSQSSFKQLVQRRKKLKKGVVPRYTTTRRTEFEVDDYIDQPRVLPLVCYFLYYFQMVAYVAYQNIGFLNSFADADEFVDSLLNDHAAVTQNGEVYRLITCSFAHTDPWQLFVMLLALYTLGSELESLIGYSAFTAVYFLAILVASSADVLSGDFPVTQSSSAAIAAMLGAVLAHQMKNWSFEIQVEEARKCPSDLQSAYDELTKAEVSTGFDVIPFFEDIFTFTATMSRKSKVLLATAGAVISGGRSLLDATQLDTYTTFTGLAAGLASGFVLTWLMSPTYKVHRENGKPLQNIRPTIVVNDQTTKLQRGLVVTIFNCALFYVVYEWVL